jgi:hypothetical protein
MLRLSRKSLFRFSQNLSSATGSNFLERSDLSSYRIEKNDESYLNNKSSNEPILAHFQNTIDSVVNYTDEAAFKRLENKEKLKVRERVERLIDSDSPFLELS